MSGDPPRLLCDRMLGALARWLRFAGVDTLYAKAEDDEDDEALLLKARESGRLLLTRDSRLARAGGEHALLIRSRDVAAQLAQVVAALQLPLEGMLQRCSRCNGPLRACTKAPGAEVTQTLPPQVRSGEVPSWVCVECGQHYWEGTHTPKIRATLAALRPAQG